MSRSVARSARISGDKVTARLEGPWHVTLEGAIFGPERKVVLPDVDFLDLVRVLNGAARERRRLMRLRPCP